MTPLRDADMRRLADQQLRQENIVLRRELKLTEAQLVKCRQIVAGHRTSPWTYLPLYTMDTVHRVRDEL